MKRIYLIMLIFIAISPFTFAQETDNIEFSLETIYGSREFSQPRIGSINWFDGGNSYTKLERAEMGMQNILKYDTRTGESKILIDGKNLIPIDSVKPLRISSYEFSSDRKLLLIFTNTKRVWRAHTRGDYWILNLETNKLKKLGGNAKPSTLMFATLSPDNKYVGYVRENNLYIESVLDDESGGGVTFSGGEPLIQIDFLDEMLKACKKNDLSTVVDTCGYAATDSFKRIYGNTDLFLYDLKLFDDDLHKKYTGVSNKLIKENLEFLSS